MTAAQSQASGMVSGRSLRVRDLHLFVVQGHTREGTRGFSCRVALAGTDSGRYAAHVSPDNPESKPPKAKPLG